MSSSDFDPYVAILGPNNFEEFNDDDPDGGTNSRLITTLPADGTFSIVATSYAANESGRYTLSLGGGRGQAVRSAPVAPAERAQNGGLIQLGQTVAGALQPGDSTLQSGEYADDYRFVGRRGQRIRVELTSSAFDAYTILRTPSGDQTDADDSDNSTDAVLDMVLPEDGEYEVSVTSYQRGETGSYRFSVTTGAEPPRQAAVQGGARIFAVMVGVSDYGGAANNLDNTDQDALQLAEQLRRDGSLNEASVTLINSEAAVQGVRNAFRQVAAQAGPDDTFLFFFSGHGGQTATPVGGLEPDGKSETIVMRDGQISDEELGDLFGTLRTRLSLLILDSCFSGGFARNVVDRPGVMGLFSSEEDLTSAVADKFRAGAICPISCGRACLGLPMAAGIIW
ncbi:MAG: caspase family protein [Brevundimonas sp.]|nr:MAG: caspase family protein [Brevundimonas sp.]